MMFFFILEWCWLLLVQRFTGLMFFLAEEKKSAGRRRQDDILTDKWKLDFELWTSLSLFHLTFKSLQQIKILLASMTNLSSRHQKNIPFIIPLIKKNIYKFYLKCRFCFQKIKISCHVFCPAGNECMRSFFLTILTFAFSFIRLCKLQPFSSTSFAFHDLFLWAKHLSLYLEIYMKNRLCLWIWSMYVQFVIFDV